MFEERISGYGSRVGGLEFRIHGLYFEGRGMRGLGFGFMTQVHISLSSSHLGGLQVRGLVGLGFWDLQVFGFRFRS